MINIIDGPLGAGKTYFAVQHITHNYCDYDEFLEQYRLKPNILLITNIDGLKVKHQKLDELLENHGGFNKVFSREFNENLHKKYETIIYLIDEAQEYWNAEDKRSKQDYLDSAPFLRWSRHAGVDLYLITQSARMLPRTLYDIVEQYISTTPRSDRLKNIFRYQIKSAKSREIISTKTLVPDQKVFKTYKSMDFKETEKTSNIYMHQFKWIGIFACIGILALFTTYKMVISPIKSEAKQSMKKMKKNTYTQNQNPTPKKQITEKPVVKLSKPPTENKIQFYYYHIMGTVTRDQKKYYYLNEFTKIPHYKCNQISVNEIKCLENFGSQNLIKGGEPDANS